MTNEQRAMIEAESKTYAFRNGHPFMRDIIAMSRPDLCEHMRLAFETGAETGFSLAEAEGIAKGRRELIAWIEDNFCGDESVSFVRRRIEERFAADLKETDDT
jgi:hypothetical protein